MERFSITATVGTFGQWAGLWVSVVGENGLGIQGLEQGNFRLWEAPYIGIPQIVDFSFDFAQFLPTGFYFFLLSPPNGGAWSSETHFLGLSVVKSHLDGDVLVVEGQGQTAVSFRV